MCVLSYAILQWQKYMLSPQADILRSELCFSLFKLALCVCVCVSLRQAWGWERWGRVEVNIIMNRIRISTIALRQRSITVSLQYCGLFYNQQNWMRRLLFKLLLSFCVRVPKIYLFIFWLSLSHALSDVITAISISNECVLGSVEPFSWWNVCITTSYCQLCHGTNREHYTNRR